MTLVLASGSPRRRELLARLGIPFEVVVSNSEERAPRPLEEPAGYASELAAAKAECVAATRKDAVILAADTVVALDHRILGKPADRDDAVAMLLDLAGRSHEVITAVVVRHQGEELKAVERTAVSMRSFARHGAERYVDTGEPMDKAGAYAIQGTGAALVTHIDGCYENVVGLPLGKVRALLVEAGVELPVGTPGCTHLRPEDGLPLRP